MNDTPSNEDEHSVLRPFEGTDAAPLPPVEPSKVVPAPPAAEIVEEPAPEIVEDPVAEISEDAGPVTAPEPPAALDDTWEPADTDEPTADEPPPEVEETELAAPVSTSGDDTITLPRTPFLAGLAVMVVALIAFALLWQSAGDDGQTATEPVGTSSPAPVDDGTDDAPDDDPVDVPRVVDTAASDAAIAGLNTELQQSRADVAGLESEVEFLQARPAPALPGDQLRRIVVGADAKFISAAPESVAVVGAFGGVSLIDPATNRVVANGNVANGATRVMRTASSVWLTNYSDSQILRVDPATNTVSATFAFLGPDGIEKDGDTLVVASFDGELVARVDPSSGEVLQSVSVGGRPTAILSHPDHGLWAAVFNTGELVEIDRDSFEILQRVIVGSGPVGIGFDATHLWVTNHDEGTIAKVDPGNGEVVLTVVVGEGPTELVAVNGSVWVTVTDEGNLVQVDAATGDILTITPLGGASAGGGPTGISYGADALWIAMQGEQSVVRIDL